MVLLQLPKENLGTVALKAFALSRLGIRSDDGEIIAMRGCEYAAFGVVKDGRVHELFDYPYFVPFAARGVIGLKARDEEKLAGKCDFLAVKYDLPYTKKMAPERLLFSRTVLDNGEMVLVHTHLGSREFSQIDLDSACSEHLKMREEFVLCVPDIKEYDFLPDEQDSEKKTLHNRLFNWAIDSGYADSRIRSGLQLSELYLKALQANLSAQVEQRDELISAVREEQITARLEELVRAEEEYIRSVRESPEEFFAGKNSQILST